MSDNQAIDAARAAAEKLAEQEAFAIGFHAYIWGYIYVKSMLLKEEATHPAYPAHAPLNALHCHTTLAKPGFTDFTPNIDTLYGLGWLDLSQGPVLMHVPQIENRYWTVQATDYALNCAEYVGSRMGSEAGVYAYARRGWQGELPAGAKRIDLPTNTVFIQLRTLVQPDLPGDFDAVVAINRKFKFQPLNPNARYAAVSDKTPPRSPKNTSPSFHTLDYFSLLNEALAKDNVIPGEEPVAAQFAVLGIGPGQTFDASKLSEPQRRGLQAGVQAGFQRLTAYLMGGGEHLGGWRFMYKLGRYGDDYLARSATACFGYGANEPEEAIYPFTPADTAGRPLDGAHAYRLRFTKEQLPPVDAFWSITMYNRPENQLIENPIDRYNVSSLTPGLRYCADGSLEILIQHARPAETSNWLPAPAGAFWIILRMYVPGKAVQDHTYAPPGPERL